MSHEEGEYSYAAETEEGGGYDQQYAGYDNQQEEGGYDNQQNGGYEQQDQQYGGYEQPPQDQYDGYDHHQQPPQHQQQYGNYDDQQQQQYGDYEEQQNQSPTHHQEPSRESFIDRESFVDTSIVVLDDGRTQASTMNSTYGNRAVSPGKAPISLGVESGRPKGDEEDIENKAVGGPFDKFNIEPPQGVYLVSFEA